MPPNAYLKLDANQVKWEPSSDPTRAEVFRERPTIRMPSGIILHASNPGLPTGDEIQAVRVAGNGAQTFGPPVSISNQIISGACVLDTERAVIYTDDGTILRAYVVRVGTDLTITLGAALNVVDPTGLLFVGGGAGGVRINSISTVDANNVIIGWAETPTGVSQNGSIKVARLMISGMTITLGADLVMDGPEPGTGDINTPPILMPFTGGATVFWLNDDITDNSHQVQSVKIFSTSGLNKFNSQYAVADADNFAVVGVFVRGYALINDPTDHHRILFVDQVTGVPTLGPQGAARTFLFSAGWSVAAFHRINAEYALIAYRDGSSSTVNNFAFEIVQRLEVSTGPPVVTFSGPHPLDKTLFVQQDLDAVGFFDITPNVLIGFMYTVTQSGGARVRNNQLFLIRVADLPLRQRQRDDCLESGTATPCQGPCLTLPNGVVICIPPFWVRITGSVQFGGRVGPRSTYV